MARKRKSGDYEVGYGKPPREHQFRAGEPSRNPLGAPRKRVRTFQFGSLMMNETLMKEMYRSVTVREGDKTVEIPGIEAVVKAMKLAAIKGDVRAQRLAIETLGAAESINFEMQGMYDEELLMYKAGWTRKILDARKAGRPEPQPIPHPDDIIFDWNSGEARIIGPTTKEKKKKLDSHISNLDDLQEELDMCRTEWGMADNPGDKAYWLSTWHGAQKSFDLINDSIAPRYRKQLKNRSCHEGASKPGSQAITDFPEDTPIDPALFRAVFDRYESRADSHLC
jgi:hypothetical protein